MSKSILLKLPVVLRSKDAIKIMEVLPSLSRKIIKLEARFNHSIVSDALVQLLSLNESVESTRI